MRKAFFLFVAGIALCLVFALMPARAGAPRFFWASGDPVVRDLETGLMWQRCSAGQSGDECQDSADSMTWQAALAYCEDLSLGGHADWRLPDRNELQSIVCYDRATAPRIDPEAFPGTPSSWFWSSSSSAGNPNGAWDVSFGSGDVGNGGKSGTRHVRCARGGLGP